MATSRIKHGNPHTRELVCSSHFCGSRDRLCRCTGANRPSLELSNEAGIPGVPEARFWADEWPKYSIDKLETFTDEDYLRSYPEIYNNGFGTVIN